MLFPKHPFRFVVSPMRIIPGSSGQATCAITVHGSRKRVVDAVAAAEHLLSFRGVSFYYQYTDLNWRKESSVRATAAGDYRVLHAWAMELAHEGLERFVIS